MCHTSNKLLNRRLTLTIAVTTVFILFSIIGTNSLYAQQQEEERSTYSIVLTAKLVDNQYRWIGSNNATNPTLNITSGVDNQITIKSLEDDPEEHELIIEGISSNEENEELVKSDEIEEGSSDTINFNLEDIDTSDYQSFEYYCEYHPETMRGKVQIN